MIAEDYPKELLEELISSLMTTMGVLDEFLDLPEWKRCIIFSLCPDLKGKIGRALEFGYAISSKYDDDYD